MNNKTVFGLSENIASALAYVGMCVTGLLFFVFERENKTVKFHALQSLLLFGALWIVMVVGGWLPLIGGLIAWLVRMIMLLCWILLTFMAYKGTMFKIPVLGDAVWEQVNK